MRCVFPRLFFSLLLTATAVPLSTQAQQAPENFRWIDFHGAGDQDVVVWINRSLAGENWTAIREIGVEYDAALVITTQRATPRSAPGNDTFTVWTASLTSHEYSPLLKGMNLRLASWMMFAPGRPRELAAFYDNCVDCEASTFFTSFHYDIDKRAWAARWMNGDHAAPVWTGNTPPQIALTQVYSLLSAPDGREFLASWRHFDYGKEKPIDDFVYVYDVDPFTDVDRTQPFTGKQADEIKRRLCHPEDAVLGLMRGQDSPLCQTGTAAKTRWERKPVTTPPANNHGLSVPPGSKPAKASQ